MILRHLHRLFRRVNEPRVLHAVVAVRAVAPVIA